MGKDDAKQPVLCACPGDPTFTANARRTYDVYWHGKLAWRQTSTVPGPSCDRCGGIPGPAAIALTITVRRVEFDINDGSRGFIQRLLWGERHRWGLSKGDETLTDVAFSYDAAFAALTRAAQDRAAKQLGEVDHG